MLKLLILLSFFLGGNHNNFYYDLSLHKERKFSLYFVLGNMFYVGPQVALNMFPIFNFHSPVCQIVILLSLYQFISLDAISVVIFLENSYWNIATVILIFKFLIVHFELKLDSF